MGCEASHAVAIEDKCKGNKSVAEEKILLTDLQVDVIRSTWPILAKDLTGNGCKVMCEVFNAEPKIRNMFTNLSGLSQEELWAEPEFQEHGRRFMETIQLAAEHVEDNDTDHTEVLMMLGAKHATVPGFDLVQLGAFSKALNRTWESVLGEEYTEDVREAWAAVFEHVSSKLRDGYLIYMEDQDNDANGYTDAITTISS